MTTRSTILLAFAAWAVCSPVRAEECQDTSAKLRATRFSLITTVSWPSLMVPCDRKDCGTATIDGVVGRKADKGMAAALAGPTTTYTRHDGTQTWVSDGTQWRPFPRAAKAAEGFGLAVTKSCKTVGTGMLNGRPVIIYGAQVEEGNLGAFAPPVPRGRNTPARPQVPLTLAP